MRAETYFCIATNISVKKLLSTLFILALLSVSVYSQSTTDTIVPTQAVPPQDSSTPKPVRKKPAPIIKQQDTLSRSGLIDSIEKSPLVALDPALGFINNLRKVLQNNPYFNFMGPPVRQTEIERNWKGSDLMFYLLVGLFFYFALIKTVFGKYVNNLLAIFLRITLKQQQLREQLLQSPLPSLLLNFLFVLTGGLYTSLLLNYYHAPVSDNFWIQTGYCSALLVLIYSGKLIIIKSLGWIFNISRAADTYIFIVFLVNKMLGIFLLPFLVLIVFEPAGAQQVFVTLSLIFIVFLFLYRMVLTFRPLQNEIRWSLFQFFIYLCAFELAPLVLIYKVLIKLVEKSI